MSHAVHEEPEEVSPAPDSSRQVGQGSVREGVLTTVAAHVIGQAILWGLGFPIGLFIIGISQIVYMLPLLLVPHWGPLTRQGMAIAMGITFLVNTGGCFVLLAIY